MPIILQSTAERLSLTFPAAPTMAQLVWTQVKPEVQAALPVFSEQLQLLDVLLTPQDNTGGTVVYFHRLTSDEYEAAETASTERGLRLRRKFAREVACRAVDGWEHLIGVDLQPVQVPSGGTSEERRAQITDIVAHFPPDDLVTIAGQAISSMPEDLLKNWQAQLNGSSSFSTGQPGASIPVATAVNSMPQMTPLSPVTEAV